MTKDGIAKQMRDDGMLALESLRAVAASSWFGHFMFFFQLSITIVASRMRLCWFRSNKQNENTRIVYTKIASS
jgi:hypothetical protein